MLGQGRGCWFSVLIWSHVFKSHGWSLMPVWKLLLEPEKWSSQAPAVQQLQVSLRNACSLHPCLCRTLAKKDVAEELRMPPFSQKKTIINPKQRRIQPCPRGLRLDKILSHPSHLPSQWPRCGRVVLLIWQVMKWNPERASGFTVTNLGLKPKSPHSSCNSLLSIIHVIFKWYVKISKWWNRTLQVYWLIEA